MCVGGAERLVVDCASALQQSGHEVHFFTNYHDKQHCYPETRDGQLAS
jgi:alpha-1,3/alpha-1,6-mannosyltransferase